MKLPPTLQLYIQKKETMININGFYFTDEYKDYEGCGNCEHQPEPLRMCEYGKNREVVEPICRMWERRSDECV